MKNNPTKLWLIVLALGWLFDFLFWDKGFGVNFALFWTLCLVAAFTLLLQDGLRPHRSTLWLLPIFGFFAAVTFLRAEPMTTFLAVVFTLLALILLTVSYLGGQWIRYTLVDYFSKAVALLGSLLARPAIFSSEVRKAQNEAGVVPQSKINIWSPLRGILIALPIVAVFASLLSSADVVFGQRLDDFIELFRLEKLPEYIFRSIYILVVGYALAGIVLHAANVSTDEKLAGEDKPILPPFLGFIESSIVLGSVVALFAAFVVIQFQYFFGGETNINVEGYTYAEYARNGFGELVAVAFFALLMLLTLSGVTKRETETQRKIFSGLGVTLVLLLLVMLVSAYQRLNLYEAAYGFSRLRTYTHVFLIWLGLLLVATIVLEILRKERAFAFAMLIASIGFAASLPILDVDAFIVKQNIQREIRGLTDVDLDANYFVGLSDDAIPPLVETLRSQPLPDSVHENIASALACIRHQRETRNSDVTWQAFHVARLRADNALASISAELDEYRVTGEAWDPQVITPSGEKLPCYPSYWD